MSLVCCEHPERDVRIRIQVQVRGEQPMEHTYAYCRECTADLVARYTEALGASRERPREMRIAPPSMTRKALRGQWIQD